MDKKTLDYIISYILVGGLFTLLVYMLVFTSYIPDVHVSHSTGECVKVINYGDQDWSCDNLPSKYTHIWVQ